MSSPMLERIARALAECPHDGEIVALHIERPDQARMHRRPEAPISWCTRCGAMLAPGTKIVIQRGTLVDTLAATLGVTTTTPTTPGAVVVQAVTGMIKGAAVSVAVREANAVAAAAVAKDHADAAKHAGAHAPRVLCRCGHTFAEHRPDPLHGCTSAASIFVSAEAMRADLERLFQAAGGKHVEQGGHMHREPCLCRTFEAAPVLFCLRCKTKHPAGFPCERFAKVTP